MGLFDSLLKTAAKAIDTAASQKGASAGISDLLNKAEEIKRQTLSGQPQHAPQSAAPKASAPVKAPKPARLVKDTYYDDDENDNEITVEYSFMLSGDFLPFECNAGEIDYSAVYEPDSDDEYGEYDSNKPVFIVANAAENYIYDMAEDFKNGKAPSGTYLFEPVSDKGSKVYFRAKTDHFGKILYFYGMDRGNLWKNTYIGAEYPKNIMNTPLEERFISEVDSAVSSYREKIIDQ